MSPQKRRKGPGRSRLPKPEPEPEASLCAFEMMTLPKVAEYLNCHYGTIYRLVRAGDFPAFRLGGSWRVQRSEIEKWIGAGAAVRPKSLLESLTRGKA